MAVFWAGTLPVMAGLGVAVQAMAGTLRRFVPAACAIAMIVVGLLAVAGRARIFEPTPAAHSHAVRRMSIAESPAAPPRAAGDACAHCGLEVPRALVDEGAERQFCCHGCRAVYAVIHEHGLDRYYAFRAEADAAPEPASPTGRSYAELDDPGFQARACWTTSDGLAATELYLEGVHCAACVWLVERLPGLVPGVVEVRLDLPRSRALVRWDARVATLSAAARQLDALGYRAHPSRGQEAHALRRGEDRRMLARIGLAGAAAANVMAIAFALYGGFFHGMEPEYASLFRWASLAVTVPAMIWGGGVFFRGAWAALRVRALHMDLPISVGLLAGFLHGAVNTVRGAGDVYFDSVTALIFLLLAGRYIQRRQQRVAADSAELLSSLAPSAARLLLEEGVREVPIEALVPGSRVEVRAGDTVPADGVISCGPLRSRSLPPHRRVATHGRRTRRPGARRYGQPLLAARGDGGAHG